ncbi:hypothetical protein P43SY_010846 [Pythium insidiosum]|uniref:Uncharacterized protein n=1 Tax=Pythium insidiosum TaxID=114742 RepID=A0AAD5Q5I7_PYTIN|nr:hypothetical protein P43SY_010846 [Pythium insidiosum]
MLTTNEALVLVEALVQRIPEPSAFQRPPKSNFTVVARRSPREPIEVDCRAIRLVLRFDVLWNQERIIRHIYELMDLLSWLAACPGCTVPENPFLWQQIVAERVLCDPPGFHDDVYYPVDVEEYD